MVWFSFRANYLLKFIREKKIPTPPPHHPPFFTLQNIAVKIDQFPSKFFSTNNIFDAKTVPRAGKKIFVSNTLKQNQGKLLQVNNNEKKIIITFFQLIFNIKVFKLSQINRRKLKI